MDTVDTRVVHRMYGPGVFLGMATEHGGDCCAVEFDKVCPDGGTGDCCRILIVHAALLQPEPQLEPAAAAGRR